MLLNCISLYADDSIADRFAGGFVHKFHDETHCITRHYTDLVKKKIHTGETTSVIIILHDAKHYTQSKDWYTLLNGLSWPFDFEIYSEATDDEKKAMILRVLQECLLALSPHYNWDVMLLSSAYSTICNSNYKYTGINKLKWKNISGNYYVKIYFEYHLRYIDISVLLFKAGSRKSLALRQALKAPPYEFWEEHFTVENMWISDSCFLIKDSGFSQKTWQIDFSDIIT